MKYFGIRELVPCVDGHCKDGRCGYDESTIVKVPSEVIQNAIALVENVLDPAREKLGMPIKVNSGHRCEAYNRKVGGVSRSQHIVGEAADIHCDDNAKLAKLIVQQGRFDQLIIYPTLTSSSSDATRDSSSELGSPSLLPRFLHVSYKCTGANRHRVLRKTATGYAEISHREIC